MQKKELLTLDWVTTLEKQQYVFTYIRILLLGKYFFIIMEMLRISFHSVLFLLSKVSKRRSSNRIFTVRCIIMYYGTYLSIYVNCLGGPNHSHIK